MKKAALILFLSLTLWSCISEDEQKGIDAVQKIINADIVAVGSGTSIDTKKGEIKYKTLTLRSGTNLNDPEISDESITSLSALTFYQNIAPETLEGKDGIKVIIERNLNGNSKTIETLYFIDTLKMINNTLVDCNKLCKAFVTQNYNEVCKQIYSVYKNNTVANQFESQLKEIDSNLGKTKSYMITGFKTKTGTHVDGSNVPVVQFYIDLYRDSLTNKLDLDYSLRKDLKGVININL